MKSTKDSKDFTGNKDMHCALLLRVKGVQLGFLIISQAGGVAMTIPPSRLMVAETEL
jgi:hypothetical protein